MNIVFNYFLEGNDSRLECDDYKKLQNKVSLKNI